MAGIKMPDDLPNALQETILVVLNNASTDAGLNVEEISSEIDRICTRFGRSPTLPNSLYGILARMVRRDWICCSWGDLGLSQNPKCRYFKIGPNDKKILTGLREYRQDLSLYS